MKKILFRAVRIYPLKEIESNNKIGLFTITRVVKPWDVREGRMVVTKKKILYSD